MTMNYNALMLEHAERVVELLKANATHQAHLHELPSAAQDRGLSTFCPGCELIIRSKRVKEMAEAKDDTRAQRRFGGKSRRDTILERFVERKRIEEAPVQAQGPGERGP